MDEYTNDYDYEYLRINDEPDEAVTISDECPECRRNPYQSCVFLCPYDRQRN